jgi:hypothetical protein
MKWSAVTAGTPPVRVLSAGSVTILGVLRLSVLRRAGRSDLRSVSRSIFKALL